MKPCCRSDNLIMKSEWLGFFWKFYLKKQNPLKWKRPQRGPNQPIKPQCTLEEAVEGGFEPPRSG